jgi:hypothetical protein
MILFENSHIALELFAESMQLVLTSLFSGTAGSR